MSQALTGTILSVLDVNFLSAGFFQPLFTDNLVSYLAQQAVQAALPTIDTAAPSYLVGRMVDKQSASTIQGNTPTRRFANDRQT